MVEAFGNCNELQGNIANVGNRDDSPGIEGGNGAFSLDFVDMEVDVEVDHEKIEVEMYKEA